MRETRTEQSSRNNEKINNEMALNTCLSIITLNVSGLSAPIKRHKVSEWMKIRIPIYMLPTSDSF